MTLPSSQDEEERYAELQAVALQYARDGETESLEPMLVHGLPVNLANSQGNTLLMLAAYHDHPETVQMLLQHGAEVDRPNDRGQTPLAGVAFKGYHSVAKILLEAGANPLASQGVIMGVTMTPVRFAMLFGRKKIQKLFEEHQARTFHDDSSRSATQPDVDKEGDALRRRLYSSYLPRSNASLTEYPSGSRKPQHNDCEIFGLSPSQQLPLLLRLWYRLRKLID